MKISRKVNNFVNTDTDPNDSKMSMTIDRFFNIKVRKSENQKENTHPVPFMTRT
jgi:hypothetical protein